MTFTSKLLGQLKPDIKNENKNTIEWGADFHPNGFNKAQNNLTFEEFCQSSPRTEGLGKLSLYLETNIDKLYTAWNDE